MIEREIVKQTKVAHIHGKMDLCIDELLLFALQRQADLSDQKTIKQEALHGALPVL